MAEDVPSGDGKWIRDLPKPPVPDLQQSLERYLDGLHAILPSIQFEQTKRTIEEFLDDSGGDGVVLQRDLEELAKESENWVTELWIDDMYLSNTIPLPINSNPFYLLPRQSFRSTIDYFKFAVKVVQFCHNFKKRIDDESLSQEFGTGNASGRPFCMETYRNFFGSCRIPGLEKDSLWTPNSSPFPKSSCCSSSSRERSPSIASSISSSSHHFNNDEMYYHRIIVASRNQFFLMKLSDDEFEDDSLILDCLRCISFLSKENEEKSPTIGILTSDNRRTWASVRSHMMFTSRNRSSIEAIETSEFILCLDDNSGLIRGSSSGHSSSIRHHSHNANQVRRDSISRAKMDNSFRSFQLLTGGGTSYYSANRWYDKFMNFVVGRDGVCGLVIEHTGSEGITLIRFLHEFLNFIENPSSPKDANIPSSSSSNSSIHRVDSSKNRSVTISSEMLNRINERKVFLLKFDVDDYLTKSMIESSKRMDKLVDDPDLYVLTFREFGKDFIKSQSMSPDAFIQIALQLTHYKVHRRLVSSYESAGLRQFRFGRVDNIRSCTMEALTWARAMCDELMDVTEEQKVTLFQECMKKQVQILKYTISGEGPDNHLMGLKEMARKRFGRESNNVDSSTTLPMLFREKAYKEYLNFRLSTSQLPSRDDIVIGYGPVVPDGYGCSYNPCSSSITFVISSFFKCAETSSEFFARSLEGSLLQMREVCLKIQSMKEEETLNSSENQEKSQEKKD